MVYYRFKQPKKSMGRGIKHSLFLATISKENKIKLKEQIKIITPIGMNREQELCLSIDLIDNHGSWAVLSWSLENMEAHNLKSTSEALIIDLVKSEQVNQK